MLEGSIEENYGDIELSKGEIAFRRGDFSAAYQHYIHEEDIGGLYKVAKKFEDEGKLEKSAKAIAEALRIKELDN